MQYSICKDSEVNNTVTKIKNILKSLDIEIKEVNYTYPVESIKMPGSIALFLFN